MHHVRTIAACLLWLLLLCPAPGRAATGPVTLEAATRSVELSPHVRYFHDRAGSATPAAVFETLSRGGFRPLPGHKASFGFKSGAFWFHADVLNRGSIEQRWLLVQQFALSDRVDLYLRYPDGRITHQASGDFLPFNSRAIRYRHPNFWVGLPQGQPVQLLLRVESESSMQVPLALYQPGAFAELARDAQLVIGVYYGILLALLFYNLVLWLWLRDSSYFWYLFHVAGFGLVLFCLNGLAFEYLWPDSAWLQDKSVPLSICLALLAMQQFARKFLELDRRWPLGGRIGIGFIAFFALLGLAALVLPYRISTPLASLAVFPSVAFIAIQTAVVLRGYRPAWLFLLAWSMFLLGTAAFSAVAFGLLPRTFLTEYGVQIGSALEMLLLSVALGYRYAVLRSENERIVHGANEELERNVETRTAELRNALGQLADANHELQEFSRLDPLTGLANRHHLREELERHLQDCRERRAPLSVLMADLDHFKLINDGHGHLVGDECLRWASRCMSTSLRDYDAVVARFGGEEFVAVLPDADSHLAHRAAEALRACLQAQPLRCGDQDVPISISVGVHTVAPGEHTDPENALQRADEALYRAKREGRNCVRHSLVAA